MILGSQSSRRGVLSPSFVTAISFHSSFRSCYRPFVWDGRAKRWDGEHRISREALCGARRLDPVKGMSPASVIAKIWLVAGQGFQFRVLAP
ncbi:hypothetical protein SAMN06265222_104287 [Neorhodopirellula lusitana]|uniref:Uncharacterized protein n=1 Tax=Neorhodopirellula lusitana TaxID=445327 RepID=A0ABY1Q2L0_9BACT|nr:hypothetical protein SAMN06265222_104287 [Neorhodopirellula lusitana]